MNAKKNKTKFSKLRLRNSVVSNSPNNEKISSYFPILSQENYIQPEDDEETSQEDRPKSAPISLEINDSIDEKDFIKKKPTRQLKLSLPEKRKKPNEDIQLAIALAQSIEDQKPSTSDSADLLRKTLEQYGFKSKMIVPTNPKPSKRKKSKFIRTVLFLRTEQDRQNIIQDKISQIISNTDSYDQCTTEVIPEGNELLHSDKPSSFMLRDMYDSESSLFKKCSLYKTDDSEYFNGLVDPKESCKVGSLLRNWHAIPGREKTPPRDEIIEKEDINTLKSFSEDYSNKDTSLNNSIGKQSNKSIRVVSPELFSDDDEVVKKSLSPDKAFVSPIKCYESFNDAGCFDMSSSSDDLFLSKGNNCIDLTQTSEESNDNKTEDHKPDKITNNHSNGNNEDLNSKQNSLEEMVIDFEETKKSYISDTIEIESVQTETDHGLNNEEEMEIESVKTEIIQRDTKEKYVNVTSNKESDANPEKNLKTESFLNTKLKSVDTKCFLRSKSFSVTSTNCIIKTMERSKSFTDTNTSNDLKIVSKTDSKTVLDEIDEIIDYDTNLDGSLDVFIENNKNDSKITNIDLTLTSDDENDRLKSESIMKGSQLSIKRISISPSEKSPIKDFSPLKGSESSQRNSPNVFVLSDTENDVINESYASGSSDKTKTYKFNESCTIKRTSSSISSGNETIKTYKFNESCIRKIDSKSDSSDDENECSQSDNNFSSISLSSDEELNYSSNMSFKMKEKVLNRSKKIKNMNIDIDEHIEDIQNNMDIDQNINDIENFRELENNEVGIDKNFDIKFADDVENVQNVTDSEQNESGNEGGDENSVKSFIDLERVVAKNENIDGNLESLEKNFDGLEPITENKNYIDDPIRVNNIDKSINVEIDDIITHQNLDVVQSDSDNRYDPWDDHYEYPNDFDDINQTSKNSNIDNTDYVDNKAVETDVQVTNRETPDKVIENVPCTSTNTPDNQLIVKTRNITPMPNYHDMDTPERYKELDKFGLKPMTKPKSVKILEYIYNATHPITSNDKKRASTSKEPDGVKRRKVDKKQKFVTISNSQVRRRLNSKPQNYVTSDIKIVGDEIANSEDVTDMIFEKKYPAKVQTCRIPLHIVWHNFVTSQPELLENILLYEPLQIEELHLKLKKLGFNFEIQDLISFLDKKCITIRVNQNNRVRRKKRETSN